MSQELLRPYSLLQIVTGCVSLAIAISIPSHTAFGKSAKPETSAVTEAGKIIDLDFNPAIVSEGPGQVKDTKLKLICPPLSEAPKIDGATSEPTWQKALLVKQTSPNSGPSTSFQIG